MLKFVIFDLDETLYPTTNGLMQAIGTRMRDFIVNKYQLSPDDARSLQNRYWHQYGTTLRGLYLERQMDPSEYLKYVHDVPLADYLAPDPKLRAVLERIPQEKVILTNSDAPHTQRVLEHLGIADQFTRIFDIVSNEYDCKPALAVYSRALKRLGARGDECALVEDAARNILPARQLGIKTILLVNASTPGGVANDAAVPADAVMTREGTHPHARPGVSAALKRRAGDYHFVPSLVIETIYDVADALARLDATA